MSSRYLHLSCPTCDVRESLYCDSSSLDLFTIQDDFLEIPCDDCKRRASAVGMTYQDGEFGVETS